MHKAFSDPVRLVGNLLAVMLLVLGLAYGVDLLWRWFGGKPWAFCGLMPLVRIGYGMTASLLLAFVGAVLWVLSGFKSRRAVVLIAGAVLLTLAPQLMSVHLGEFCGLVSPRVDSTPERSPKTVQGAPSQAQR